MISIELISSKILNQLNKIISFFIIILLFFVNLSFLILNELIFFNKYVFEININNILIF